MTIIRGPDTVDDAIDEINEFYKEPLRNVAKFYVYKYLTEEEGAEELEFDAMKLGSFMSDVLYNYATYATSREASNGNRKFRLGIYTSSELFDRQTKRTVQRLAQAEEITEEEATEKLSQYKRDFKEIIDDNTTKYEQQVVMTFIRNSEAPLASTTLDEKGIRIDMKKLARQLSIGDPERPYLDALSTFFGTDWEGIIRSRTDFDEGGWAINYGGDAWSSVCDTAQFYTEFGQDAFIDLILSVEHNNGNFLDKWPTPTNEPVVRAADTFFPKVTRPEALPNTVTIVPNILDLILQLARETDLYELWKLANTDNAGVRRYEGAIPDKGGRITLDESLREAVISRPQ
jgi:hypothetical protein